MKKLISLLLAALLALSTGLALAETSEATPDTITIGQVPFTFALIPIEGTNYQYGVPDDWNEEVLTEDELAWGYIGRWVKVDESITLNVMLEEVMVDKMETGTVQEYAELMKDWKGYTGVGLLTIDGTTFIGYSQPDESIHGLLTMLYTDDGENPMDVRLDFTIAEEASEANVQELLQIASLLGELPDEEAGTEDGEYTEE